MYSREFMKQRVLLSHRPRSTLDLSTRNEPQEDLIDDFLIIIQTTLDIAL